MRGFSNNIKSELRLRPHDSSMPIYLINKQAGKQASQTRCGYVGYWSTRQRFVITFQEIRSD